MVKNKNSQSGFAHIIILVIVIIVLIFGAFVLISVRHTRATNDSIAQWKDGCKGTGKVMMTHAPMDMKDVQIVYPLGTLAAEHVTPIDHLYYYPKDMKNRDASPVYAMADGYIVDYENNPSRIRLVIQHNCSTFSYFDLLTSLDPSISGKLKEDTGNKILGGKNHLFVKSGQVIGKVGAQSLDTAIYDADMTLPGFAVPGHYKAEFWKIHTADFFSYFDDPIKSQMLALNPRTAEPRSGKIDFDVKGTLSGNWFKEGTYDYVGGNKHDKFIDDKGTPAPYWKGHFSIAPDTFDPSLVDLSFGDYNGQAKQFTAVKGTPDPSKITKETGIVKYQLYAYNQPSPFATDDRPKPQGQGDSSGVVLLQVISDTSIKMEAFPGKNLNDVNNFSSSASVYNR